MKGILDPEEIERLRKEMEFERKAEKNAETPLNKISVWIMLISLIGGMIGAVIASILGAEMIAGWLAIQAFAVAGYVFFFGSFSKNIGSRIAAFSFPLAMAIGASAVLIGCGAYMLVRREVIMEDQYQFIKGVLVCGSFIIVGLLQMIPTIFYRIQLKTCCTEPVDATCVEVNTVKLYEVNDKPVFGNAPIWQYYFNDAEHVVLDNVYKKKGEMPEVGVIDEILVDPKKPERILSKYCLPSFSAFRIIFGFLLIAIGISQM